MTTQTKIIISVLVIFFAISVYNVLKALSVTDDDDEDDENYWGNLAS